MKLKIYQVDAFTDRMFSGNPAAVCPLENWPSDDLLQKVAAENNLAETAFYVKKDDHYHIRWFTPTVEVNLCGHATLATAFVLFNYENHRTNDINFYSDLSGKLSVHKHYDTITLDFPSDELTEIIVSEGIQNCFSIRPIRAFKGENDYLLIFKNEQEIRNCQPHLENIAQLGGRGIIISSPGEEVDFVSRYFAPQLGINEDPVTGSAHSTLTPYWSQKLGKKTMQALQLSQRKGWLRCTDHNGRIEISGNAVLYLKGEISI